MKKVTFEQMSEFILSRLDWTKGVDVIILDELGDMETETKQTFEIDNKEFEVYRHEVIEVEEDEYISLYDVEQVK